MRWAFTIISSIGVLLFGWMLFESFEAVDLIETVESQLSSTDMFNNDILNNIFNGIFSDDLEELIDLISGLAAWYLLASLSGFVLSLVLLILSIIQLASSVSSDKYDVNRQLLQLAEMRDKGIISQDEFEAKKREVML